jgi:hypothetical protein
MSAPIRDGRFEQLKPSLRRWLLWSVVVLVSTIMMTAVTYGERPALEVSAIQRTVIAVIGCAALAVFAFTGGLLVYERLLRRSSPVWREKD